ncbi:unnamed protein product, partial [Sphenostylis stenocarpa]
VLKQKPGGIITLLDEACRLLARHAKKIGWRVKELTLLPGCPLDALSCDSRSSKRKMCVCLQDAPSCGSRPLWAKRCEPPGCSFLR